MAPDKEEVAQDTSEKIREEQEQIGRVQEWWSEGNGAAEASRSPILASIEEAILSEIIAAGGGYHSILSADRLDGMHRRLGSGAEPSLEPLRKALQTRGGAKSQARVVGMLLFKEARSLYEQAQVSGSMPASGPAAAAAPAAAAQGSVAEATAADAAAVKLDERFSPARRYVCSDSYPEGAQMAVRSAPNQQGDILAKVPAGSEYMATGRVGEYLQVAITQNGVSSSAYVLHTLGDLVLLVPASTPVASAAQAAPAGSEAAALDEAWPQPRRYVCAETYPAGAQMAARTAPSRDSQQVATLPPGTEYLATGRIGEYLQVSLEIEGARSTAYVLHSIGDMTLLVPEAGAQPAVQSGAPAAAAAAAAVAAAEAAHVAAAAATVANDNRVEVLEAKVSQQERQIQALQTELAMLKSQLSAVASAFRPIASGGA